MAFFEGASLVISSWTAAVRNYFSLTAPLILIYDSDYFSVSESTFDSIVGWKECNPTQRAELQNSLKVYYWEQLQKYFENFKGRSHLLHQL